jgi:serine phosphatase RsbU (regulator of sigma subunit)
MEISGRITSRLFGHLKTRFYESTNIKKLVAMLYGEITDLGRFCYISAGHPPPLVFSRKFGRIMPLDADRTVSSTPIGIFPAAGRVPDEEAFGASVPGRNRAVNEIELLGSGDILLLATDGLTEHVEGRFASEALERTLDRAKDLRAGEICGVLRDAVLSFGPPTDDITFVVIKRR